MSDRSFIDSNILVYAHTNLHEEKQKVAQQLIVRSNTFVSTQVLQELINVLYNTPVVFLAEVDG